MASVDTQHPPTIGPPPEKKLKSEIDCEQCGLVKSKYTCPKCSFRTCSLPCVKLHKEANNCDGQRKPFEVVKKLSQFDDNTSIKDQEYLNTLKSAVSGGIRSTNNVVKLAKPEAADLTTRKRSYPEQEESPVVKIEDSSFQSAQSDPNETFNSNMTATTGHETSFADSARSDEVEENEFLKKHGSGPSDPNTLSHIERYLISNAVRRRIFITINSPMEADGSRHEQHSDTIIWTCSLKFLREVPCKKEEEETNDSVIDDVGEEFVQVNGYTTSKYNKIIEYDCSAKSIPENLTVNTLIRQFVKPKEYGTVVSKKELDAEKMQPFWDAGLDGVFVFMKVPVGEKERYYMVDKSKSILDNLRNRYIIGHPKFIIILPNQFQQWQTLSEMEAQELHDERRVQNKVRHQNDGGNRGRGNFNRRNGGRGGGNHFGGNGGGFRGGRGGNRGRGFRGGHRGGGGRNRELASRDLSDIFEPFSSPAVSRISRPNYSSNSNDAALTGWASAVNSRNSNN
uniref:HIT-type domain-containing protein n=1 Tax=Panagrolaimus sp. PS1159 TaxID=55785 RepID=A0AC35FHX8_9BILA